MQLEFISTSPQQTAETGKKLSKLLKGGDVLLFSGELGGGKTTFISGQARGLGIPENLSSPSFTILNEYGVGKFKLIHIDLYRLDSLAEFENIGLDDYIYNDRCIVCVEWGEKVREYIKKEYLLLDFGYVLGEDSIDKRKIIFRSSGPLWEPRIKILENRLKR